MPKVIGIDILAGASSQKRPSSRANKFAAVVMENGQVIESRNSLSTKNLVKLCKVHEPQFLGVDNIFEIEANSQRIIHFCSLLPLETKVLQVTGAPPDGFESLNRLAKRHGIPYPSQHANPLQTAQIICQLAEKKVGYILMPFEEESEIKISRGKAIGPGGWSQQRYSRRMRGEILTLTREIEKQLQDHSIDFDLEVRKTEYGYDNASFRAYTSLASLRKVVKSYRGELLRVSVSPIRKKRLEFYPATGGRSSGSPRIKRRSNRGLIVGIDPGPNTGIAILNFSGTILLVDSLRSAARGDIIRLITTYGDPTLVAADVRPPPDFVVKISKMLNTGLYFPERLLSADDKSHIVDDFTNSKGTRIKGSHKRDALCAAIKAYQQFDDVFDRINRALSNPEEMPLRNMVKQIVIKEKMNIHDAIEEAKRRTQKVERPEIKQEEKEIELTENESVLTEKIAALNELIIRQTTQIENLEDMNEGLFDGMTKTRNESRELNKRLSQLTNKKTQELKRERAIKTRDDELRLLRRQVKSLDRELGKVKGIISDLKRMIVMNSNRVVVPMKVIYEFSREGIEKTIERMNIEPFDVVLLLNPSGGGQKTAEMLIEREVRAVVCTQDIISNKAMEAFIHANVPVLFEIPIRQIDDIAITFYEELEQAISDWEEQKQRIQGEKTEKKLGVLIAEYQSERREELSKLYSKKRSKRDQLFPRQQIKTIEKKEIDKE
ncbi:MAG: DUF460 domain-containing protein [Candidatus Heimdallarchaeota archaeon]